MKIINIKGHPSESKSNFILNVCLALKSRNFDIGAAFFDCNCHAGRDLYEKFNIPVKNYYKDLFATKECFNRECSYLLDWSRENHFSHLILVSSTEIEPDKLLKEQSLIFADEKTQLEALLS